jgi:RimJ/RimL family protein N-acetyltransferase
MALRLETPRLFLRDFEPDDAPRLYELDHDPEVMRFIGPFALESVDDYRCRIESDYAAYAARADGLGLWAVIEKTSAEFLGWVCLRPASQYRFAAEAGFPPEAAELGYRLRVAAWGRGIATEAARGLIEDILARRPETPIVSTALETNRASIRVMKKCGLAYAGRFELPGFSVAAVKYFR